MLYEVITSGLFKPAFLLIFVRKLPVRDLQCDRQPAQNCLTLSASRTRYAQSGRHRASAGKGAAGAFRAPYPHRITSYNVCYTKLLRIHNPGFAGEEEQIAAYTKVVIFKGLL